jgi:membrane protein
MTERKEPVRRSPADIVRCVWREAMTDRTLLAAGGLAFFTMFALLPALAAVGALYGLVMPPGTLSRHLAETEDALPEGVYAILDEFVTAVPQGLGLGVALGFNLVVVLWTVQRSASGLITALNIVHDIPETRGRVRREGAALAVAFASLLFLMLALFLIAVLPLFDGGRLLGWLRWPLLAILFLAFLAAVYRIAPAEAPRRAAWITTGAAIALLLWLGATALFALYLAKVGGFGAYYGSLTAPVVLMSWLFLTSWAVMIGAEVNEQIVETHDGAPENDVKEQMDRA